MEKIHGYAKIIVRIDKKKQICKQLHVYMYMYMYTRTHQEYEPYSSGCSPQLSRLLAFMASDSGTARSERWPSLFEEAVGCARAFMDPLPA